MTAYFAAAAVLLAGLAPLIVFSVRASPPDGLVALNFGGTIATLVLLLLARGDAAPAVLRSGAGLGGAVVRRRAGVRALPGALAVTDVLVWVLLAIGVLLDARRRARRAGRAPTSMTGCTSSGPGSLFGPSRSRSRS